KSNPTSSFNSSTPTPPSPSTSSPPPTASVSSVHLYPTSSFPTITNLISSPATLSSKAFSHSFASDDHHVPNQHNFLFAKSANRGNGYTFPFILKSLSDSRQFIQGQSVHSHLLKLGHPVDVYVCNSLLNLYDSCGNIGLTRQVFDEMPLRDVMSWTVLIMGYRDCGKYDDALIAFETMQYAGLVPNRVTMVNALVAYGGSGAIEMGVWIHEFITRNDWELDVVLGTALVDMYMKCGRVQGSQFRGDQMELGNSPEVVALKVEDNVQMIMYR
ncbi:Pentatricopeptide repeat-containing protein At3g62890, partial [Linum perenne]